VVNSITALTSKDVNALFYPYNVKSRAIASLSLLKFVVLDSGIVALSREKSNLDEDIKAICKKHNLDYKFINKLIKIKSDFNPYKIGLDGSVGLLSLPLDKLKELNCKNPFNYKEYLDKTLDVMTRTIVSERFQETNVTPANNTKNLGASSLSPIKSNGAEIHLPLIYDQLFSDQFSIK
jgi:hypothetical protein